MSKNQIEHLSVKIRELEKKIDGAADFGNCQIKPSYTPKEVASLFGVSLQTLNNWRKNNVIGYSQNGKTIIFSFDDIKTFLSNFHKGPDYKK